MATRASSCPAVDSWVPRWRMEKDRVDSWAEKVADCDHAEQRESRFDHAELALQMVALA